MRAARRALKHARRVVGLAERAAAVVGAAAGGPGAEQLAGWASGAAGASKLLRLLAGHGEAELAVGHMIERYSTPYGA